MSERTSPAPTFLTGPHGRIACRVTPGDRPTIVWLGGFRSDMTGTKATHLEVEARRAGRAFLRFDYSGHGVSEGEFLDGTISAWTADARAAIDALTKGPLTLVGSSMGGWIAARLAPDLAGRLAGIVFVAPAPDFTEDLVWATLTADAREALLREGKLVEPADHNGDQNVFTLKLIEDGRRCLVLHSSIRLGCPVRILQGMADSEVPYAHALRLADAIEADDLVVTLVKSGDHRLSDPASLERLSAMALGIGVDDRI